MRTTTLFGRNPQSARRPSQKPPKSRRLASSGVAHLPEALEGRTFLHADPTAAFGDVTPDGVTAGGTHYWFKVSYSDDEAVAWGTIGNGDVRVTGPGGYSQPGTLSNLTHEDETFIATYRVAAPGGTWDVTDNGTYTVSMEPDAVADTSGAFVPAGELGETTVELEDLAPTASLDANDVTNASTGHTHYWFKVTYCDDVRVDYRSINNNDVLVTGPHGYSKNGTLSNMALVDGHLVVTYRIPAPGGSWNNVDNGLYTVTMAGNEVTDSAGNSVAAGTLGAFEVKLADKVRPTASFLADDVTAAGGAHYWFRVDYDDNVAVDYLTIDNNDVRVTGPGGFSAPGVLASLTEDNGTLTAIYRIAPPGGAWDAADNGEYAIVVQSDQVADKAGNFVVGGELGHFQVVIPEPVAPPVTAGIVFSDVSILDETLGPLAP